MSDTIPTTEPTIDRKFICTYLTGNNNKWWRVRWWAAEQIMETTFNRVGNDS